MGWVFPCLRNETVVPVDVVWVEPQFTFFNVLFDWGSWLFGGGFHFGGSFLGDFADKVVDAFASQERDVVPWGDEDTLLVEEDAEVCGVWGALCIQEGKNGGGEAG